MYVPGVKSHLKNVPGPVPPIGTSVDEFLTRPTARYTRKFHLRKIDVPRPSVVPRPIVQVAQRWQRVSQSPRPVVPVVPPVLRRIAMLRLQPQRHRPIPLQLNRRRLGNRFQNRALAPTIQERQVQERQVRMTMETAFHRENLRLKRPPKTVAPADELVA